MKRMAHKNEYEILLCINKSTVKRQTVQSLQKHRTTLVHSAL